jgi:hypothetical protein
MPLGLLGDGESAEIVGVVAAARGQHRQHLERLLLDSHHAPVPPQLGAAKVQLETTEAEPIRLERHPFTRLKPTSSA